MGGEEKAMARKGGALVFAPTVDIKQNVAGTEIPISDGDSDLQRS